MFDKHDNLADASFGIEIILCSSFYLIVCPEKYSDEKQYYVCLTFKSKQDTSFNLSGYISANLNFHPNDGACWYVKRFNVK